MNIGAAAAGQGNTADGGAAGASGSGGATGSAGAAGAGGNAGAAGSASTGGAVGAAGSAGTSAANTGATGASGTPSGHTELFFTTGSASLDPQSAEALASVARRLLAAPDSRVAVSGYTDSTGSYDTNVKLAAARAATVRSALIVAGVDVARIEMRRPAKIVSTDAPDKSRRVDLTLSSATGG
nr:OmpA family protein [Paraburkholderia ginsengiterrae]